MANKVLDEKKLATTHKQLVAIKNSTRLEIVKMLSEKPKMNVTQIQTKLNIEQPATSLHLKVLRLVYRYIEL